MPALACFGLQVQTRSAVEFWMFGDMFMSLFLCPCFNVGFCIKTKELKVINQLKNKVIGVTAPILFQEKSSF